MTRVADALPEFSLLCREMERCGWTPARVGPLGGDLFFQTPGGGVRTPMKLYHSDRGEPLLVIDFGETALGGRDELYPRFLDFPLETRMALGVAERIASAKYLLLMSADRIELFRLPEESLEYQAAAGRDFEDELLPGLAAKARSRPEPAPGQAGSMEGANALRGWITHWSRRLAAQLEIGGPDCEKFLWKLILMLQTRRKTGQSEMLGGWGLGCEELGKTWTLSYDSVSTHEDFARVLDEFEQTFSTRIFSGDAEMHKRWLARLEESSFIEQLRAELLMQSQLKFEAENVALLYADMDRESEGWRREVAGLPSMANRVATEGWMVIRPLECDVAAHGLLAALRDFERLAQFWSEHDAYLRSQEDRGPEALFSQPDLFLGAPRGVGPSNQLDDGLNFLFSGSLRLTGVAPDKEFGVGLAFLLKALSLSQRFDWPFFGIDTLDSVLSENH